MARIGGDEFIVFLKEIQEEHDVLNIANKISETLNQVVHIHNKAIPVACSIGLSLGNYIEKNLSALN